MAALNPLCPKQVPVPVLRGSWFFSTESRKDNTLLRMKLRTAGARRKPNGGDLRPRVRTAARWGRALDREVRAVLSQYPAADPEAVRRTLICLQSSPLERLNRSLRRGRGFAAFRK
jgi:hypothetical protein